MVSEGPRVKVAVSLIVAMYSKVEVVPVRDVLLWVLVYSIAVSHVNRPRSTASVSSLPLNEFVPKASP
jgi:hypothetical protein